MLITVVMLVLFCSTTLTPISLVLLHFFSEIVWPLNSRRRGSCSPTYFGTNLPSWSCRSWRLERHSAVWHIFASNCAYIPFRGAGGFGSTGVTKRPRTENNSAVESKTE
jgi:hypothetical protein